MFYVGVQLAKELGKVSKREVFVSETPPTKETHGHLYQRALGPYKTQVAAEYMAGPGYSNPCCITPNDAERLANLHMRN